MHLNLALIKNNKRKETKAYSTNTTKQSQYLVLSLEQALKHAKQDRQKQKYKPPQVVVAFPAPIQGKNVTVWIVPVKQ